MSALVAYLEDVLSRAARLAENERATLTVQVLREGLDAIASAKQDSPEDNDA